MAYEYIGTEDLYFVSGGSAKLVKTGQRIREDDEDYFLKRYPNKIREIPGTTSRRIGDIDTLSPSTQELVGLKAVVESQSEVIKQQGDQIDKLIKALSKSVSQPNQKIDKLVEVLTENANQPVVFQPTIQAIPQPSSESKEPSQVEAIEIEKPKIGATFIPSVVNSDGITAKGEAGDSKTEGDQIDDKISKLKRFKKR